MILLSSAGIIRVAVTDVSVTGNTACVLIVCCIYHVLIMCCIALQKYSCVIIKIQFFVKGGTMIV